MIDLDARLVSSINRLGRKKIEYPVAKNIGLVCQNHEPNGTQTELNPSRLSSRRFELALSTRSTTSIWK